MIGLINCLISPLNWIKKNKKMEKINIEDLELNDIEFFDSKTDFEKIFQDGNTIKESNGNVLAYDYHEEYSFILNEYKYIVEIFYYDDNCIYIGAYNTMEKEDNNTYIITENNSSKKNSNNFSKKYKIFGMNLSLLELAVIAITGCLIFKK